MLPYQEDRKLERLLVSLFEDDDELTSEDVLVLGQYPKTNRLIAYFA